MRVFAPCNFISSYQVAVKEMAVNWMSYLEKLSKGKRDMVNRCLEGRVFSSQVMGTQTGQYERVMLVFMSRLSLCLESLP